MMEINNTEAPDPPSGGFPTAEASAGALEARDHMSSAKVSPSSRPAAMESFTARDAGVPASSDVPPPSRSFSVKTQRSRISSLISRLSLFSGGRKLSKSLKDQESSETPRTSRAEEALAGTAEEPEVEKGASVATASATDALGTAGEKVEAKDAVSADGAATSLTPFLRVDSVDELNTGSTSTGVEEKEGTLGESNSTQSSHGSGAGPHESESHERAIAETCVAAAQASHNLYARASLGGRVAFEIPGEGFVAATAAEYTSTAPATDRSVRGLPGSRYIRGLSLVLGKSRSSKPSGSLSGASTAEILPAASTDGPVVNPAAALMASEVSAVESVIISSSVDASLGQPTAASPPSTPSSARAHRASLVNGKSVGPLPPAIASSAKDSSFESNSTSRPRPFVPSLTAALNTLTSKLSAGSFAKDADDTTLSLDQLSSARWRYSRENTPRIRSQVLVEFQSGKGAVSEREVDLTASLHASQVVKKSPNRPKPPKRSATELLESGNIIQFLRGHGDRSALGSYSARGAAGRLNSEQKVLEQEHYSGYSGWALERVASGEANRKSGAAGRGLVSITSRSHRDAGRQSTNSSSREKQSEFEGGETTVRESEGASLHGEPGHATVSSETDELDLRGEALVQSRVLEGRAAHVELFEVADGDLKIEVSDRGFCSCNDESARSVERYSLEFPVAPFRAQTEDCTAFLSGSFDYAALTGRETKALAETGAFQPGAFQTEPRISANAVEEAELRSARLQSRYSISSFDDSHCTLYHRPVLKCVSRCFSDSAVSRAAPETAVKAPGRALELEKPEKGAFQDSEVQVELLERSGNDEQCLAPEDARERLEVEDLEKKGQNSLAGKVVENTVERKAAAVAIPALVPPNDPLALTRLRRRATRRPTHFVALRVDNSSIVRRVYEFQKSILRNAPHLKACAINPAKLHISLLIMVLSEEEVAKAIVALKEAVEAFRANRRSSNVPLDKPIPLDFDVVGTFGMRVLFGTIPEEQQAVLHVVHKLLTASVQKHGLQVVGLDNSDTQRSGAEGGGTATPGPHSGSPNPHSPAAKFCPQGAAFSAEGQDSNCQPTGKDSAAGYHSSVASDAFDTGDLSRRARHGRRMDPPSEERLTVAPRGDRVIAESLSPMRASDQYHDQRLHSPHTQAAVGQFAGHHTMHPATIQQALAQQQYGAAYFNGGQAPYLGSPQGVRPLEAGAGYFVVAPPSETNAAHHVSGAAVWPGIRRFETGYPTAHARGSAAGRSIGGQQLGGNEAPGQHALWVMDEAPSHYILSNGADAQIQCKGNGPDQPVSLWVGMPMRSAPGPGPRAHGFSAPTAHRPDMVQKYHGSALTAPSPMVRVPASYERHPPPSQQQQNLAQYGHSVTALAQYRVPANAAGRRMPLQVSQSGAATQYGDTVQRQTQNFYDPGNVMMQAKVQEQEGPLLNANNPPPGQPYVEGTPVSMQGSGRRQESPLQTPAKTHGVKASNCDDANKDGLSQETEDLLRLYDKSALVDLAGADGTFFPHMTIMKTSQGLRRIKNRRKKKMLRIVPECFHKEVGRLVPFGRQEFVSIDFLELTSQDPDGYYHKLLSIPVVCSDPPAQASSRSDSSNSTLPTASAGTRKPECEFDENHHHCGVGKGGLGAKNGVQPSSSVETGSEQFVNISYAI